MEDRYLVTGSSGCIGAWAIRRLIDAGSHVVALDVSDDDHRLRLLMSDAELDALPRSRTDIRVLADVEQTLARHRITHVVHLAALQLPFCQADPVRGAEVNVVGTTNLLEAIRRTDGHVRGVSYASSAAVYGASDLYPRGRVDDDSLLAPQTLYGVYKQANEGTARLYASDYGVGSIGLRPCIVYGPGRDQGMTSDPTKAMVSALAGRPAHIAFGGSSVFQHADDSAAAFIAAAQAERTDATVVNLGGPQAEIASFIAAIEASIPEARGTITQADDPLSLPSDYDGSGLDALVGPVSYREIDVGVAESVDMFRDLLAGGLVSPD